MASKFYGYYQKGNKLAIVQKDTRNISSDHYGKFKSPTESVTDGLEIEYSYAPVYSINDLDDTVTCEEYLDDGTGQLTLRDTGAGLPTNKTHIVIEGSGKFDGLHEVHSGTTELMVLKTKYNGNTVSGTFTVYTDILAMIDESYIVDVTEFQAQAIVYFMKAKMSEEVRDVEGREYFMRLFKKQIEKASGSRKRGPYFIQGYSGMRNY